MKTAKRFQRIIEQIATAYQIDLSRIGASLRLEQSGYMPLVIEVVGRNQVSVAHYYTQNGDLLSDPEIVFFTGYSEWVPLSITMHPIGWYLVVGTLNDDETRIARFKPKGQADIASFANRTWAVNLKDQGWLDTSASSDVRVVRRIAA